jgi:hypothetical protein
MVGILWSRSRKLPISMHVILVAGSKLPMAVQQAFEIGQERGILVLLRGASASILL